MNHNTDLAVQSLHMARDIVFQEYTERRNHDHQKWLWDADVAWRSRGVRLPYPEVCAYPTESEIVARARTLYDYLIQQSQPSTITSPAWDESHSHDTPVAHTEDSADFTPPTHAHDMRNQEVPMDGHTPAPHPDVTSDTTTTTPAQPNMTDHRHWGISPDHLKKYAQLHTERHLNTTHDDIQDVSDVIIQLETQRNELRRNMQL